MSALSRASSSSKFGGRESMLEKSSRPAMRDPDEEESDVQSEIEDDDLIEDEEHIHDEQEDEEEDFEPNNYQNDRADLTPIKGASSKDESDHESNEKMYQHRNGQETDMNIDGHNEEEGREQLQEEEEDDNVYQAQAHQREEDNEEQSMQSANFAYAQQEPREYNQFEKQQYLQENSSPIRRGQARENSEQMNTAQYTRLLMQECGAHQKTRSNTLWEDTKFKNQWEQGKPNKKIIKPATSSGVGHNGIKPAKPTTERAKQPTVGWNYYYKSNIFGEPKAEEEPQTFSSPQRETLAYGRSSLNSKQTFHLVGDKAIQHTRQESTPNASNSSNKIVNSYRDRMLYSTKRIY